MLVVNLSFIHVQMGERLEGADSQHHLEAEKVCYFDAFHLLLWNTGSLLIQWSANSIVLLFRRSYQVKMTVSTGIKIIKIQLTLIRGSLMKCSMLAHSI